MINPRDPGESTFREVERAQQRERERLGIKDPYEAWKRLPLRRRLVIELVAWAIVILLLLVLLPRLFAD